MVPVAGFLVFAHGNDPGILAPGELFGNWALAAVALGLAIGLCGAVLRPVFEQAEGKTRSEVAAWAAISLGVVLAMLTWITRQSLLEALSPPPKVVEHAHAVYHGGQMVMWGDYHAEIARAISGEYRIWMSDKYRRSISARFFQATLYPRDPQSNQVDLERAFPLDVSLDNDYLFAIVDREIEHVQIRIEYPGDYVKLDLDFDGSQGKKSLPDWCGY